MIERLETCIISLNAIKENLEEYAAREEEIGNYREEVGELLSVCRSLSSKWEGKLMAQTRPVNGYNLLTEDQSGRGRPRFSISKEQLLYLSSMSFNWTAIARMLGACSVTRSYN